MTRSRFAPSLAALAAILLATRPAPAQTTDLSKLDASFKSVPADVSFYSTSLRLGEQMDRFLASNAFAKLRALPAVQLGLEHLHQAANQTDNPFGQMTKFFHDPANHELTELIHDFWRREVFVYGGANWTQVLPVLAQVSSAQQFAPLQALLMGGDPSKAQGRAVLKALNASADKLQAPEMVFGFRLDKSEPAIAQIKRLEAILTQAADQFPPLKGRVKRQPVAGSDALTVTLDGALVPWDQIPWSELEDQEGELQPLVKRLKSLTLTVSLLVKDNFLLLAIAPTTATVEKFGRGPALATRPEMRPLAKFADQPLLEVSYSSQALAAATATTGEDIEGMFDMAKTAMSKAPISDQRRKLIENDLKQVAKEVTAALPKPSASLRFAFQTPRGQEGYAYHFDTATADGAPLTILDHVGGSPLVAVAGHISDPVSEYKDLVRVVKMLYGHAEAVVKELVPEEQQQQIQAMVGIVQPFLKRFDDITGTQLLPALGAGQMAFVLDARWTSKAWFPGLDQGGKELPMLEAGVVRSVRDSAQLLKALQAYRELLNEVLAKVREFGAPVPEGGIPPAEAKKVAAGTVYFWPLPPFGQDQQIQPNLGLSDKVVTKSLSVGHSERLLTATPLKMDGGPLAEKKPLLAASVVDFAGLIGAAGPWIEQFALPAVLRDMPDNAPNGLTRAEIPVQVRTVLDVLQCIRNHTSVTYREGTATVTHSELVIRDLK